MKELGVQLKERVLQGYWVSLGFPSVNLVDLAANARLVRRMLSNQGSGHQDGPGTFRGYLQ